LQTAFTDLQKLNALEFETPERFYQALCHSLADGLGLESLVEDSWDTRITPHSNFERYLRREVLRNIPNHLVWGIDEVDRLFGCRFGSDVFRVFCSWSATRQLDPLWERLSLILTYVTELSPPAGDPGQYPAHRGTRLSLADFSPDQVTKLNELCGRPLKTD